MQIFLRSQHATTVAVADYQVLTNGDGLLAAMRAKGYTILAPGEQPPADAVGDSVTPTTDTAPAD